MRERTARRERRSTSRSPGAIEPIGPRSQPECPDFPVELRSRADAWMLVRA
jgi:hypothetical protein